MTAAEAQELAEKLKQSSVHEITIALLKTDRNSWKQGYTEAIEAAQNILKGENDDPVHTQKEL